MDDLFKVPNDVLIKDLKKQLSKLVQKLSANEQYIMELEENIQHLLHSTDKEKLLIKTEHRVQLLVKANVKFRKQIKELNKLNNRYLVKILTYEKNIKADNT